MEIPWMIINPITAGDVLWLNRTLAKMRKQKHSDRVRYWWLEVPPGNWLVKSRVFHQSDVRPCIVGFARQKRKELTGINLTGHGKTRNCFPCTKCLGKTNSEWQISCSSGEISDEIIWTVDGHNELDANGVLSN